MLLFRNSLTEEKLPQRLQQATDASLLPTENRSLCAAVHRGVSRLGCLIDPPGLRVKRLLTQGRATTPDQL